MSAARGVAYENTPRSDLVRARLLLLSLAGGIMLAVASPAVAQPVDRPRLEPLRVTGEVVLGGYASIGGFLLGRYAVEGTAGALGVEREGTLRTLGLAGGVIVGGLATSGTVYAIGNIGDQTGDMDATLAGTAIGFVAALGIARVVLGPEGRPRPGDSTARRWAIANVLGMLPSIGATIGFNSTLRYR